MSATEAQARRAVRRADFEWDEAVKDPRAEKNQRHAHYGMLAVTAAAFACGRVNLRRVEDFSGDLDQGTRRKLGIGKGVSDTTLYRTFAKQTPKGLRETVRNQVRELIDAKVVQKDLFPFGVVSIDGKCLWSSHVRELEGAKTSLNEETGLVTSTLTALRAVLTSSKVRPCLDLEVISHKSGEAPAFRELFPRVSRFFGGQFELVTADAGLTCRENALLVVGAGKHYLFALKGNQPKLHAWAQEAFASNPGDLRAHDVERRDGKYILRELHVVTVKDEPELDIYGLRQLWRVRQVTSANGKLVSEEVRYFLSSIPPTKLKPTQQLALVQLHWGIENGHHWTLDVALQEDDVQPCQASRDAVEVIGWLRTLGYNLLAAWRAQAPKKDRAALSWTRTQELLRDALMLRHGIESRAALS